MPARWRGQHLLTLCVFGVSAIATAATHDIAATATHDVSKACIHVDETAPPCANDATLAFVGSAKGSKFVQKDNCATCVCGRDGEDEWRRLNNASRAAAASPEPWGRCAAAGTARRRRLRRRGRVPAPRQPKGPELFGGPSSPSPRSWSAARFVRLRPGAASTLCLLPTVNAPSASFDPTAFADHAEVAWRLGTTARTRPISGPRLRLRGLLHGQPHGLPVFPGHVRLGPREAVPHAKCARTHMLRRRACPAARLDLRRVHAQKRLRARVRDQVADGCCQAAAGTDDDVMHGSTTPRTRCAALRPRRGRRRRRLCGRGCWHVRRTDVVWNVVATEFVCVLDAVDGAPPSARRCYLNQDHLGDEKGFPFTRGAAFDSRGAFDSARWRGSLERGRRRRSPRRARRCHVGNCLYDNATAAPDIPVVDHVHRPQPAVSA